jgi:hypothetical protein
MMSQDTYYKRHKHREAILDMVKYHIDGLRREVSKYKQEPGIVGGMWSFDDKTEPLLVLVLNRREARAIWECLDIVVDAKYEGEMMIPKQMFGPVRKLWERWRPRGKDGIILMRKCCRSGFATPHETHCNKYNVADEDKTS